jgi:hypothetical protein
MNQLRVCSMVVVCLCVALRAEAAVATWDRNPEPNVVGYVLAYGTTSGVYTTEINVGNVLSYEFFPPSGYRYYLVVRAYSELGAGPNSSEVVLDLTTTPDEPPASGPPAGAQTPLVPVTADFDGDGRLDPATYDSSSGAWRLLYSSASSAVPVSTVWGTAGDVTVEADYDGDRRADLAVFRPSTGGWWVLSASGGMATYQWGATGDVPVPADYDGDQRADVAVFRPSTGDWWVLLASGGMASYQWGATGDVPVPADYDGDQRADVAVFRPSTGVWWVLLASGGMAAYQ